MPTKRPARAVIIWLITLSLLALKLAGCGDNEDGGFFPILKSLTVTPVNPSIANSTRLQLTATGIFFDNTVHDLTAAVQWASSAPQIAAVGNTAGIKGLVAARGTGTATIAAIVAGVSGASTVMVTSATLTSITITSPNPSIANRTSKQLIATGDFSDGTTQDLTAFVSWVSSAPTTVAVSDAAGSQGLVTGNSLGSPTITATFSEVSGSTTVTITPAILTSITVTPPNSSIAKGTTEQPIATGNFSDGTTQDVTAFVNWASSNPSLATVSNVAGSHGQVTGAAVGSAAITATLGGVSGSTSVTITPPVLTSIVIRPANSSLDNGTSAQFMATGIFSDGTTEGLTTSATWISSATGIAEVSNAAGSHGLVTGTGVGSTIISAFQSGVTGSTNLSVTAAILTSITINPVSSSIAKGTTVHLHATGNFSDGTTEDFTNSASWVSSPDTVARVDPQGVVTGKAVGSVTITATQAGVTRSTTVKVTPATLTSIAVTPAISSIADGTTVRLIATGIFSDLTTEDLTHSVSWIAAPASVATVDPNGLVTGTADGSATVTATQAGVSGTTTVKVTPATLTAIAVTPAISSIANGTTVQLTATGAFSDGTTPDLTSQVSWASDDDSIAQVSDVSGIEGEVKGLAVGNTSIRATLKGVSGSASVTVTAASLVGLIVSPANPVLSEGQKLKMTATAVFSDGTTENVTPQADWTSSDEHVADIISSSSPKTNGRLNAKDPGRATITAAATVSGTALTGSTGVTVIP